MSTLRANLREAAPGFSTWLRDPWAISGSHMAKKLGKDTLMHRHAPGFYEPDVLDESLWTQMRDSLKRLGLNLN